MKSKKSAPAKRSSKAHPAKVGPLKPKALEVPPDKLAWTCRLEHMKFETTDDLQVTSGIIGQPRAVDALNMALEIESVGYNVFVSGPVGTGRTTTVKNLLESTRGWPRELDDKCYVNNFRDPDQPRLIRLRAGNGRQFRRDMDEFIEFLVKTIPMLFESETYQQRRTALVDDFKERGGARVREFEKRIIAEGFALVQTGPLSRPELAPIVEKKPVSVDAVPALVEDEKLTAERAEEVKKRYQELSAELATIYKEVRDLEKQAREALARLDDSIVRPVVEERLADIEERCGRPKANHVPKESKATPCPDATALHDYLAEVKDAILARPDFFRQKPPTEGEAPLPVDPFLEFRVNVLVDNADTKTAPVIFETNPNYKNLFGSIERVWDRTGMWRTDFSKIKAGSVLRADHGFLVINALDALLEVGVWPALKRTLRNRRLEITSGDPYSALFGASGMKPEPVAIDLKVIMIGDPQIYSLLAGADEDFKKVFKVRADFDWVMDLC
ncbi:AAA family ATPase, partial [candidate division WOR-3 bacterium]|nr:AAA family ATPase [candidate division WOR-3 bacterium]